nr:ran-specific GTPase-activating protein isoform X2 [Equus caballus]
MGGRRAEAVIGGHVGGPRRRRQPPLACELSACGPARRGSGCGQPAWDSRPPGPARGVRGGGAPRDLGAAREPGVPPGRGAPAPLGLAFTSPLAGDANEGPVFSGSAHWQASLRSVAHAALHSFCSRVSSRHRPLRRELVPAGWTGPGRTDQGGGGSVGCGACLGELARQNRSAVPPSKAAKAQIFFFGLSLVVKSPDFSWTCRSPSHVF